VSIEKVDSMATEMMDNTTKFWISSKVSQRREVEDARVVFQEANSKTSKP